MLKIEGIGVGRVSPSDLRGPLARLVGVGATKAAGLGLAPLATAGGATADTLGTEPARWIGRLAGVRLGGAGSRFLAGLDLAASAGLFTWAEGVCLAALAAAGAPPPMEETRGLAEAAAPAPGSLLTPPGAFSLALLAPERREAFNAPAEYRDKHHEHRLFTVS